MISKKYNEQMGNYLAKLVQAQTNICVVKKPISNADRIRSMTDEELAKFIASGVPKDVCKDRCGGDESFQCSECVLDWLKEEEDE